MQKYVYIDESGDLGTAGSEYLVLAALVITDYTVLDRIIKNMRRNKFKKELSKAAEIKACHSSKEIIRHMLCKVSEVGDARVLYVVLEKKKLYSDYLKNDKNKLYNYVAGKLARNLDAKDDLDIRIDKSKGKQLLQQDFNNYFRKVLSSSARIMISHSHSHAWSGLQFSDVLAWACFQKFEHADSSFVDLIKIEQDVYHVW
jgi:hypothetical protein